MNKEKVIASYLYTKKQLLTILIAKGHKNLLAPKKGESLIISSPYGSRDCGVSDRITKTSLKSTDNKILYLWEIL